MATKNEPTSGELRRFFEDIHIIMGCLKSIDRSLAAKGENRDITQAGIKAAASIEALDRVRKTVPVEPDPDERG